MASQGQQNAKPGGPESNQVATGQQSIANGMPGLINS